MCSIVGAIISRSGGFAESVINHILHFSMERGRDGRGYLINSYKDGGEMRQEYRSVARDTQWRQSVKLPTGRSCFLANMRAEPTTEYISHKLESDQQPYRVGPWTIVHNGTIANDRDLRTHTHPTTIDSAAIVEHLARDPMDGMSREFVSKYFHHQVSMLKGSYAILAVHDQHPNLMLVATNYRPIWWAMDGCGVYFASSADYFPKGYIPQVIPAYSSWAFDSNGESLRLDPIAEQHGAVRALVVCSGGMDSVVAAAAAQAEGMDITLVHFRYGSRAQGPEVKAVQDVADAMGVPLFYHTIDIYDPGDSPLLQSADHIAGGEAGAEYAHEWVPARNLLMLATATAMAEAKGYEVLVLGNNLEEAGAYPDNEPEFINRFNAMLPFAVGDGKRLRVVMPVGNMMKHEIVVLGHQLGAPLHLTWSCYRAGELHCGTCGPCYMRRTAFEINKIPEVIHYRGK